MSSVHFNNFTKKYFVCEGLCSHHSGDDCWSDTAYFVMKHVNEKGTNWFPSLPASVSFLKYAQIMQEVWAAAFLEHLRGLGGFVTCHSILGTSSKRNNSVPCRLFLVWYESSWPALLQQENLIVDMWRPGETIEFKHAKGCGLIRKRAQIVKS